VNKEALAVFAPKEVFGEKDTFRRRDLSIKVRRREGPGIFT
jgi:hypothetical protein